MRENTQSRMSCLFELLEQRDLFSATPLLSTPTPTAHASSAIVMSAADAQKADAAAGTGLTAEYFSDAGFVNGKVIRTDPTVNLVANGKDKITKQSNSIIWSGTVVPKFTEAYTFSTVTKGGSQLIVNGQTIISQLQGAGGAITGNSTVSLVAGQKYILSFSYVRHGGAAAAKLLWQSPSQPLQIVPQSALYPDATLPTLPVSTGALVGQYYTGENFDQLVMTRSDPTINFNWGAGSPSSLIPANTPFSIRWTGQIKPAKTGLYTFATRSDDGIRVWVNGQLVIDDYHDQSVTTSKGAINLTAGQAYQIRVDYYQNGQGVGSVKLQYSLPGGKALNVIAAGMFVSALPGSAGVLTATEITSTEVDLAWTGSTTSTGYEVDRLDASGNWDDIGDTAPGTLSFSDTGLTPGTAYDYRVEPIGSSMASAQSNVVETQTLTESPSAPTVISSSAVDVDLTWSDVAGETGFIVLDSTNGGQTFSPIGATGQGVLSYDAVGLTPGTGYQFAVEALNADGQPSAASAPVGQTTPLLPPLLLTAVSTSSTSAGLQWSDVTGETGFVVERTSTGDSGWSTVATLPAGTLGYTDNGLSGGTLYSYRVRSLDAGGASAPSVTATALTLPSVVTAALTDLNLSTSSVSFPAVTGATSYVVQRSMDGLTGWTTAATVTPTAPAMELAGPFPADVAGTTLSATVSNIAPSTIYYYRVIASNSAGTAAPSAVVSQMSAPLAQYTMNDQVFGVTGSTIGMGSVYDLNMTAGTSALVGQMLPGAFAANRDPVTGMITYAVGSTSDSPKIYNWDPTTGNNTYVTTPTYLAPVSKAAYDSTGVAWIVDTSGNLYSASIAGVLTRIGTLKIGGVAMTVAAGNMVFSPTGSLYLANGGTVYTVNTTTAAVTPYLPLGLGNVNIVYGTSGTLYSTDSNGREYSVNSIAATLIPNSSLPVFNSLTADPAFVDLGITATATPTVFTHGQNAAYSVNVTNTGANAASAGSISATATLGTGLTFTSVAGTGWTAVASTSALGVVTVTMSYNGTLIVNGYAPTLTLNVHVASNATLGTSTTFTVTTNEFDTGILNNTTVVASTID